MVEVTINGMIFINNIKLLFLQLAWQQLVKCLLLRNLFILNFEGMNFELLS